MPNFVLTWVLTAVALMITAHIVPGFAIKNFVAALIAAVVLGLVNAVVRPILVVLTLPLTIVTLGLFLFVVNAIAIWVASAFTPGFTISGLGAALIGSIILTVITSVLNTLFGKPE